VEAYGLISDKTPVVQRQDYVMFLEFYAGMHWFHTDVFNWTPKVKKKYLEDLNLLQYLVNIPIVALVEQDNKKLAKFGEVTGWKVIDQMNLNNGKVGLVYTRSL
jgi:hypothetical protein